MQTEATQTKKTCLYAEHEKLHAKMVPFSGWAMPISYHSVIDEHTEVRNDCGIFDVSHMGEIRLQGKNVEEFLNYIVSNNIKKISPGRSQYALLLNPNGGIIDDLISYKISSEEIFVCVNASNIEKDFSWISEQAKKFSITCRNESQEWGQIAIQGPNSFQVVKKTFSPIEFSSLEKLKFTEFLQMENNIFGKMLIARTGYTGEKGLEIYLSQTKAFKLWQAFLQNGAKPIGLGARDSLRLEACYPLYGNELSDDITPFESGLSWALSFDKGDFISRNILEKLKDEKLKRSTFAFKLEEPGVARSHMDIYSEDGLKLGYVSSGGVLPTVGGFGGLAILDVTNLHDPQEILGKKIWVDIRGKRKLARIVKKPLYSARVKD